VPKFLRHIYETVRTIIISFSTDEKNPPEIIIFFDVEFTFIELSTVYKMETVGRVDSGTFSMIDVLGQGAIVVSFCFRLVSHSKAAPQYTTIAYPLEAVGMQKH